MIKKLIGERPVRLEESDRIAAEALSVGESSVLMVSYQYQENHYTVWICGMTMKVFALRSPITEALEQMAKMAVDLWKEKKTREAALTLQKCHDMAEADVGCQGALEGLKALIPEDLSIAAKKVKSFAKLLTIWTGVAVTALGFVLLVSGATAGPFLFVGVGIILFGVYYFKH